MAAFFFNGMDRLEADINTLASLSDDEKFSVLEPGGLVLQSSFKDKIDSKFGVDGTGDLRNSIRVERKMKDGNLSVLVTPRGKHRNSSRGIRMKKDKNGNRKSSGKYSGTNAEVAFILEYGSPRIRPRHWMEEACQESEEDVYHAISDAWDKTLDEKGL